MIINFFIGVLFFILNWIAGLLPNLTSLPSSFNNAWNWIAGLLAGMLYVVPTGQTLITIAQTFLSILTGIFLFYIINMILKFLINRGK